MRDDRAVRQLPERPTDFFGGGHVWIREFVLGGLIAVRMDDSGLLTVRGPEGAFEPGREPWPYRRAVEAVRADFDRDRLRGAVDDPGEYTFRLLVPLEMGVEYDWEAMPSVLGLDVWDGPSGEYVTLDVAERVFAAVGLQPVPTVAREVPARDLGPDRIDIPDARWAEGPAAGVVLQKKHGVAVSVRRDRFMGVSRVAPEPAGVADLDAWLADTLDVATVRSWLDGDRPLGAWEIETLVDRLAGLLAVRAFDAVGAIALTDPAAYRTAIRRWALTARGQSGAP